MCVRVRVKVKVRAKVLKCELELMLELKLEPHLLTRDFTLGVKGLGLNKFCQLLLYEICGVLYRELACDIGA